MKTFWNKYMCAKLENFTAHAAPTKIDQRAAADKMTPAQGSTKWD